MKRITKMFTGIALSAAMMFSGTAGYSTKGCRDVDCNHLTACAGNHICGQFVYDSTALQYWYSGSTLNGQPTKYYKQYNVKKCRNCERITSWGSWNGWIKDVIGKNVTWEYHDPNKPFVRILG